MILTRRSISPFISRELRVLLRTTKSFLILFLFLSILLCIIVMNWPAITYNYLSLSIAQFSRKLFQSIIIAHLIFVVVVVPFLFASAFAEERQKNTIELLLGSPVSAWHLLLAKLSAPLIFIFLMLTTALPLFSLSLIGGGISIAEVFIAYLVLIVTALLMGSLGIFCSTLRPKVYETYFITAGVMFLLILFINYEPILYELLGNIFSAFSGYNLDLRKTAMPAFVNPFFVIHMVSVESFLRAVPDIVNEPLDALLSRIGISARSLWFAYGIYLFNSMILIFLFLRGAVFKVRKLAEGGYLTQTQKRKVITAPPEQQNIFYRDLLYKFSPEVSKFEHNPCLFLERRLNWFARYIVIARIFYGAFILSMVMMFPLAVHYGGSFFFFSIPLVIIIFFTILFGAPSISMERERGTLDLLRTTLLSPLNIVKAKSHTNLQFCFFLAMALYLPGMLFRLYLGQLGGYRFPSSLVVTDAIILFLYPYLLFFILCFINSLSLYFSSIFNKPIKVFFVSLLIMFILLVFPFMPIDFGYLSCCSPVTGFISLVPVEKYNFYGIEDLAHSSNISFRGIPVTSHSFFLIQGLLFLLVSRFLTIKTARMLEHRNG